MGTFRRIMLSGGLDIDLDIDVDSLPEEQKIYYTAPFKVKPSTDSLGVVLVNKWNSSTKEGVIACENTIKKIGDKAFSGCGSLISMNIPDSVTSIGIEAFRGCVSLESIYIPDSVTSIGNNAFDGCNQLTNVYISDISTLCNISLGNPRSNPLYYESNLYLNNELVTDLVIPDSVTKIENAAFYNCKSIISVTIPDGVTSIGNVVFRGCKNLASITIGNTVTSIGDYAFTHCSSLTSVTIPDNVRKIGMEAFYECSSLTSVYCKPTTPPALGNSYVFDYNHSDRKFYVPAGSLNAYKRATNWSKYASAIVGYDFENGV